MILAYPLQWPVSRERNKTPGTTQYAMTLVTAYEYVLKQMALLGAKRTVISSNALLKKSGLPATKQPKLIDGGVAVWFQLADNYNVWYALSCDAYDSITGNLRAIGLSATDIRKITQRLKTPIVQTFVATPPYSSQQKTPPHQEPPPKQESQQGQDNRFGQLPGWCVILSINTNATWPEAKRAYYRLAKIYHPDLGGSPARFQELNTAYLEAKIHYGVS